MAKAKAEEFTNQPEYDPAAKGLDYGGTEYENPAMDTAAEQGYFGAAELPGAKIDGDLTVAGVAGRDVAADTAKAKAEAEGEGAAEGGGA